MNNSEKRIFVLNGRPCAGKDFFCSFVNKRVPSLHISIVDNIKRIAKELGWNGIKNESGRLFLSRLKDAVDDYNNGNFLDVLNRIIAFLDPKQDQYQFLFVDVRDENQIQNLKQCAGAIPVFVSRIDKNCIQPTFHNRADAGDFRYGSELYEHRVYNDMTPEGMEREVEKFLEAMKKK